MNADGSNVTSLTDSLGAVLDPSGLFPGVTWSPDGGRAAFTRADGALYATTEDGGGVVQVAPAGVSPIWADEGRMIAFLAADPGSELCCWNLFVAGSDGSGPTRLTEGLSVVHYDFAANGSLIVYPDNEVTTRSLILVRPDGTGRREIGPAGGTCCPQLPSLSPDGTKLAYFAYPQDQGPDGPGYEIYVVSTDGSGEAIDVSNNPGEDWWPVWSPDGSRIAFVSSAPGTGFSPGSLHVVNADGTDQTTLTPAGGVWQPAWSPDGTRIVYAGGTGARSHVFVANADGSGATDLTPTSSESSRPTWTGR
jgi:Tol biopolymer transport system component